MNMKNVSIVIRIAFLIVQKWNDVTQATCPVPSLLLPADAERLRAAMAGAGSRAALSLRLEAGDAVAGEGEGGGGGNQPPTILVGPVAAKVPVGVDFLSGPFGEPTILKIAAAYEKATKHRMPPPSFNVRRGASSTTTVTGTMARSPWARSCRMSTREKTPRLTSAAPSGP